MISAHDGRGEHPLRVEAPQDSEAGGGAAVEETAEILGLTEWLSQKPTRLSRWHSLSVRSEFCATNAVAPSGRHVLDDGTGDLLAPVLDDQFGAPRPGSIPQQAPPGLLRRSRRRSSPKCCRSPPRSTRRAAPTTATAAPCANDQRVQDVVLDLLVDEEDDHGHDPRRDGMQERDEHRRYAGEQPTDHR